MRLGTCVALEAVVGVALLGGVAAGGLYGIEAAHDYADTLQPAAEAAPAPAPVVTVKPIAPPVAIVAREVVAPAAAAAPAPAPAPAPAHPETPTAPSTAFPAPDAQLVAPLLDAPLTRAKFNQGGTSLSLRLDFASGGRAAFKPEQIHSHSNPRREIAAYRIDRLLGIGRVPPAVGREFPLDEFVAAFDDRVRRFGKARIAEEGRPKKGVLAGELSWWIPEIDRARINGFLIDSDDGVVTWRRELKVGARIPADHRWVVEQISTMTLFDFVIDNIDRWSGGNIRIAPGGRDIFFMDNTMSFTKDRVGHRKGQLYLQRVQVFSRRLVNRLRVITEQDVRDAIGHDTGPFDELLTDVEISAVMARRDLAIAYIDRLITKHGEDAVLALP